MFVDYEDAIQSIMNHRNYDGWCLSDREWAKRLLEDASLLTPVRPFIMEEFFADDKKIMEAKDEQDD